MRFLRTNTAVIITVGPFYDATDGVTIETGLTITNERITLTADTDDNSAPTNILDNVTGATSGTSNDLNYITGNDAGMMQLELSAANTNRLGRMLLSITDAANHVPVFHEFMVLPAMIYDAFVSGTDVLDSSMTQILGTAVSTPATAGILDVNVKNIDNDAASASGTVTFPNATLASTTNITAGTVTTATNVTTVNGLANNVITAASIAADAIGASELAADAVTEIRSLASGTSDSGTTTTMVDAARTEADADYWDENHIIVFTSGNIAGQARVITSFDPATDTITFSPATTQAVATQTYEIWPVAASLRPTTHGRTLDVSAGGEAGLDWANIGSPTTSQTLSGTTVGTATAVTTVNGLAANTITATSIAADAITAAKIAADAIGASELAADAVTEINASVLSKLLKYVQLMTRKDAAIATDNATELTAINASGGSGGGTYDNTTDSDEAIRDAGATLTDIENTVWDAVLADHLDSGSTGNALNAAGAAGDPWSTALPGAYGAGTAGKIIGDNINATISSRLAPTTAGRTLDVSTTGEAGLDFDNIKDATGAHTLTNITVPTVTTTATATAVTTVNGLAANVITATSIASDAITAAKVADGTIDAATFAAGAINAAAIATDAITAAKIADGAIDAATFAAGAIDATAIAANAIGASELAADAVQEIWDAATSGLTTAGSVGKLLTDNVNATISSRLASASISLTAGAVTVDAASKSGYRLSATGVDDILDDALVELSAVPAAAPSLRAAMQFLYQALRNRTTTTASAQTIQDDAGSTIATATLSDDGTTFTKGEFA